MTEPMQWLYAIDDPLLRARFLGRTADPIDIVDIVDMGHAYDRAVATQPHAIVVDDSHPATPVLCSGLRRTRPTTRIVVLTVGHRERAWQSLCAGALSVLDARIDSITLRVALSAASRGEALLDASSAAMLLAHLQHVSALHDDPFVNVARLTVVEESVLALLAAGTSIEEVAAERQVTPRAVSLHLGFAVRRLHQHTMVATPSALTTRALAMRTSVSAGSADTSR